INNPLDSSEYQSSKSIYDSLVKTIKDYSLSDEIKTKLSFDLNKCQAISAVRAGKPADQDASTYLKACGSISANRNDFIIELYKIINLQKKVANNVQNPELKITTQLYKPLLEQAFEVVGSFLNSNNYEAALDEITPLIKYANTVLTLEKYVEICIKEAAPQKLEECWNQCLMTTSSTIEKSKTLAGIFQKLHDTFESLASVDPKTKAKYEDIAKQANERAIQYTPQKEEVQVSQEKPTVSVSKKEEKALKELKALEKAQVTLGTKLINTKAKVEVIKVETLFDAEAEAEKAKLRDKLKAEEAELMARLEAKKNKQKLDIEVEKSTQLSEIRGQGSSTKDTLVTPTAPPKEVEASGSSNVVTASDSSNVAETSDSSNKSVSKGIYPSISAFKAELTADNVAAAKASSSINVYNNSPYSYTAGTHQTAPIKAVMPTSRSADPTDAAEIAADKEAAEIAAAKEAAEIAADKEAAEIAAAKEAAEIAAAKEAAEVLKTTLLKNVKEFITSSKTDTMKQIIVDCDNAIKKGINVYETVNDVKTLEVLASGFLSLNNQEKAEEICGKIAGISQDAYKFIGNNKILSLLAKKYSEIELYKSCIESCKKLYQTSEENYQLLKAIVEKTTDTDIQLDALTVAKSQTDNRKQQAELFLSKGKILLSLGKKEQASHEFGEAGVYDHDIYKNIDKETLKSLYESGNPEVGYWYLSKTHNFNHKDPSLAKKLVEFSSYLNSVHGISGEAACLIKAYLCAPNADTLVQVENDLSIMKSKPYAADYYKNCCAINNNPAQMETYLQGIVQVIDEHM
ncbi:MAG TPA: cell envelope integrity protein TolA, partial [Rickettsia endosymbiont of Sericostoma sp.]|nr:cell envelope integrity protein TolA [Rickettsia endosymbiont of Sericostoma sp.]